MAGAESLRPRQRTLVFVNIIITCVASSMLATALTTALPPIMDELGLDATTGQWLTSGYSLAMGIMMPLTAFLITRFPTRPLYLTALGTFIAGSLLCVLAPGFEVMMVGRVLQALGGGALTSMAQVITLSIFPAEKRGQAMGWYGLSVGAAPVVAPTLAGVLVDTLGWRWIFYVAIAIMAVSLVFAVRVFRNVLETRERRFDVPSFALSILAFGGVTLGIGNVSSLGVADAQTVAPLVVGVVGAVVFVRRQLRLDEPFLELRILRNRDYALSVIGSMLLYLVMMGSSVIMPLYVQNILGQSATVSGLVTLPGSLLMAVVSPFAGRIYDVLGMRRLFVAGAALMLASNLGMTTLTLQTSVWVASVLNAVRCVAIGCLMMPLVTWGTSRIGLARTADGTALLTSLRTVAGAVGSAVFVGVMSSVAAGAGGDAAASMHGLNVTFAAMSAVTVALLLIAVFLVRGRASRGGERGAA
ncbi:MDR family MFS transporter [Thermophilibacter sp.]